MIRVSVDDLLHAVSLLPKMRRAPRGGTSKIPRDTIFQGGNGTVTIETPAVSTTLAGEGTWEASLCVDSVQILKTVENIAKKGASDNGYVTLSTSGGDLMIVGKTTVTVKSI